MHVIGVSQTAPRSARSTCGRGASSSCSSSRATPSGSSWRCGLPRARRVPAPPVRPERRDRGSTPRSGPRSPRPHQDRPVLRDDGGRLPRAARARRPDPLLHEQLAGPAARRATGRAGAGRAAATRATTAARRATASTATTSSAGSRDCPDCSCGNCECPNCGGGGGGRDGEGAQVVVVVALVLLVVFVVIGLVVGVFFSSLSCSASSRGTSSACTCAARRRCTGCWTSPIGRSRWPTARSVPPPPPAAVAAGAAAAGARGRRRRGRHPTRWRRCGWRGRGIACTVNSSVRREKFACVCAAPPYSSKL